MSTRSEFRHAVGITRIELLRGWRSTVDRWTLVVVGIGLCVFAGMALFVGVIGYFLGSIIPSGEGVAISDGLRGQVVVWMLFLAGMIALQVVERRARIDNEDLMFTTVSSRTVLLGLLIAEFARELFTFGSFMLVGVTGFALGSGAFGLLPVLVVLSLPVLVFTVLLGHTAGMAAKLVADRMTGFTSLRTALGIVGGILITVVPGLFLGWYEAFGFSLDGSVLASVPIAAYVDLLALGTPLTASLGIETAVGVGLVLGLIPPLFALDHRLARVLWFGGATASDAATTTARTPPGRLARGSTGWLVWWYWLRGLREPSRFTHLIYYTFPLFWLAFDAIRDPSRIPPAASTGMAALGVLFAGAAFGLNPLGDERSALPAVLVTSNGGRFVRARIAAGFPWAFVALAGVLLGGVIGRFSALDTVLLSVAVLALCVLSATVAPALGIAFPRFEPIATTNREVITPSFGALIGHAVIVGIAGAGGLIAVFGPTVLGALSESPPSVTARVGLVCVVILVILGTSVRSYCSAVNRFQGTTIN